MEDTTEVTESESNQGSERTEMTKKPTSGKEMQNESEEKVKWRYLYIFLPIKVCITSLINCYHLVLSIVKNLSTKKVKTYFS